MQEPTQGRWQASKRDRVDLQPRVRNMLSLAHASKCLSKQRRLSDTPEVSRFTTDSPSGLVESWESVRRARGSRSLITLT